MSTPAAFTEIADNLSFLDDWEERYRYLIELGQNLEPLADDEHSAENRVQGCASQVWMVTEAADTTSKPNLRFRGDSDAMIVKGLVAILVALYSNRPAEEIAQTDAVALLDEIGLQEHLTTQRSNGLAAMVDRIREQGRARA